MEKKVQTLDALFVALATERGHLALERVTHLLRDELIEVSNPDAVRRWAAMLDELIEDGLSARERDPVVGGSRYGVDPRV